MRDYKDTKGTFCFIKTNRRDKGYIGATNKYCGAFLLYYLYTTKQQDAQRLEKKKKARKNKSELESNQVTKY